MQTSRRPRLITMVLCLSALWATPAFTQEVDMPLYEGRWNVRMQGVEAGYQSAQLLVRNWEGTWRDTSKAATVNKACRGKTFPVTVQRSTATAFEFTVFGSAVSPLCPDLSMFIKAVEGKVQEGHIDPAGKVRLERR